MNRTNYRWVFGLLTILTVASLVVSQETAATPNDANLQDPIEVQTRGPLHEGFAQPFDQKAEPGPLIPKEPPPAIPEEAPEQKPEAENAQWIPGYWAWDSQRQEYLWVSGVYRVPPQGRTFIPGYWQNTPDGWRWIGGFWSNNQELPYAPEPPATLDNGPSTPAPDDASVYVPGSWVYRDSRFIWRAGYYAPFQPGRIWNPPNYVWTPRGYLFVDGYWDLPFEERGLIFAPVYFNQPLWRDASWRYRPNFVVGFNSFFDSAFVGVGGHHFYFGNYYDPYYARNGYHPWYSGRGRYDPVFAHHGAQHYRNNPNWVAGVQQTYANRTNGRSAAPPATLAQQRAFVAAKKGPAVVTPLNQFTNNQVRLVKTTTTHVATQQAQVIRSREIAVNRQKLDAVAVTQSSPRNNIQATEGRTLNPRTIVESKSSGITPRIETPRGLTTPKVETPRGLTMPKVETPRVLTTPKVETPRVLTTPKVETPRSLTMPKVETPRVLTMPKVETPRSVPPPVAPRIVTPPNKKAAVNTAPARTVTKSPTVNQQRSVTAPSNQARIQSAPRVQAPPRVSAPARSSSPARSTPVARPANARKR